MKTKLTGGLLLSGADIERRRLPKIDLYSFITSLTNSFSVLLQGFVVVQVADDGVGDCQRSVEERARAAGGQGLRQSSERRKTPPLRRRLKQQDPAAPTLS
ncbi:MAG: hypothetical protein ACR2G5_16450 [Pyrinomonadaceae bacterium]